MSVNSQRQTEGLPVNPPPQANSVNDAPQAMAVDDAPPVMAVDGAPQAMAVDDPLKTNSVDTARLRIDHKISSFPNSLKSLFHRGASSQVKKRKSLEEGPKEQGSRRGAKQGQL